MRRTAKPRDASLDMSTLVSASAPVFAAMVSRINEERLAAKQAPLGFLNPFLYANAGAFTDVTLGDDKIGRGGDPLPYGFVAAKGWDPVTGLGTPNYAELAKSAWLPPGR